MKLDEIVKVTNADLSGQLNNNCDVTISTDTRTIKQGDLYLPLKGVSFDGEQFIEQAITKGAIGAFVTSQYTEEKSDCIFLQVPNTLIAYLQLANYRRHKINPKVIGITGSSGKTTTKELVASVLSEKYNVFKTPLNHNNEIGLCQTIFEMPDNTDILVLEMGMRGLGEIELLSKYAEPDITIIANVGTAHIGRLGSRENIAKAKCEIVKYQRGNIFIAHDDEIIKKTVEFDGKQIYYSLKNAEVIEKSANYSKFVYNKNTYELNVGGDYNIENALSAINAGIELGLNISEIQNGLKKYKPIEKRWESVFANGYEIINDSYNANPESMKAFVDTVFEHYDNYTLILGDMGELGKHEIEYHKKLGEYINNHKNLNPNMQILSIGVLSQNITDMITNCKTKHFDSAEKAVKYIITQTPQNSILFLKASRSMKFENIIELLKSTSQN